MEQFCFRSLYFARLLKPTQATRLACHARKKGTPRWDSAVCFSASGVRAFWAPQLQCSSVCCFEGQFSMPKASSTFMAWIDQAGGLHPAVSAARSFDAGSHASSVVERRRS